MSEPEIIRPPRNHGWVPFDGELEGFYHIWLDKGGWNTTSPDSAHKPPTGTLYGMVAIDYARKVVVFKEVLA